MRCRSFGWIVTRFAWITHSFESSFSSSRKHSHANWSTLMASGLKCCWLAERELNAALGQSCTISRTNCRNGFYRIRIFVLFCSLGISCGAPDSQRCVFGFLPPPSEGLVFFAALVTSCLRGALPPVDFDAVFLVHAIVVMFDEMAVMILQKKILTTWLMNPLLQWQV